MPSSLFKLHFGFHGLRDLFPKDSMSTSFFGQELQRALKEQGLAVQNYKILNASPLQASARVKLLEGHSINITLTQQGYNVGILQLLSPSPSLYFLYFSQIDCKANEGTIQIFETVEDLFRSTSPLYAQRRSDALFEALKRLQ